MNSFSTYAIIPLIAGVLNLITALIVFKKDAAFKINRRFSLLCISIAIWNPGQFAQNLQLLTIEKVVFFSKVSHIGGLFAAPFSLHFVIRFTNMRIVLYKNILRINYTIAILLGLLLFPTSLIVNGAIPYQFGFYVDKGYLYFVYFFNTILVFVLIQYLLYIRMVRTNSHIEKNRLRYVLVGTAIVVLGAITNFLPSFGVTIYGLGNLGSLFFVTFIFISIYKHRLMNIQLALTKALSINKGCI